MIRRVQTIEKKSNSWGEDFGELDKGKKRNRRARVQNKYPRSKRYRKDTPKEQQAVSEQGGGVELEDR